MKAEIRQIPRAIIVALAAAAILTVLLPTCTMAVTCGSMPMGSLGAILDCDSMWFASDAAPGVLVDLVVLTLALLAITLPVLSVVIQERVGFILVLAPVPHPPDDPLMGRLII